MIQLNELPNSDFFTQKGRCCICGKCFSFNDLCRITVSSKHGTHDIFSVSSIEYFHREYYNNSQNQGKARRIPSVYVDIKKRFPKKYRINAEYSTLCKEYIIKSIPFRKRGKFYCSKCAKERIDNIISLVDSFCQYCDSKHIGINDLSTLDTNDIIKETSGNYVQHVKTPYEAQLDAGKKAEDEVEFELRWLPSNCVTIKRDCLSDYQSECILIANRDFLDGIPQEIDHIVVSPSAVFVIETKNLSGHLTIDAEGNWKREKDGSVEGVRSPISQLNKHVKLLKSILGDIPFVKIVCIANSKTTIVNSANTDCHVVKYDLLSDYIESKTSELPQLIEVNEVVSKIQRHKIRLKSK